MKQKKTQIHTNTNKSTHSKMGTVRQNPIQRTIRTAHLSVLMSVRNFSTQYNTEKRADRTVCWWTFTMTCKLVDGCGVWQCMSASWTNWVFTGNILWTSPPTGLQCRFTQRTVVTCSGNSIIYFWTRHKCTKKCTGHSTARHGSTKMRTFIIFYCSCWYSHFAVILVKNNINCSLPYMWVYL